MQWIVIDSRGESQLLHSGKLAITYQMGVQLRDLRLLDPKLATSFPSAILCRERALVVSAQGGGWQQPAGATAWHVLARRRAWGQHGLRQCARCSRVVTAQLGNSGLPWSGAQQCKQNHGAAVRRAAACAPCACCQVNLEFLKMIIAMGELLVVVVVGGGRGGAG